MIEGLDRHAKEHANQRSQPTAQTMAREGDRYAGIGGLDLQVVLHRLQQLRRADARSQAGVGQLVTAKVFVVSAGVGDDDFGVFLEDCGLKSELLSDGFRSSSIQPVGAGIRLIAARVSK